MEDKNGGWSFWAHYELWVRQPLAFIGNVDAIFTDCLCTIFPAAHKYCSLIRKEGGLALLEELVANPRTRPRIRELAEKTLGTCRFHLMETHE